MSLGESSVEATTVEDAVDRVLEACGRSGTPAFVFVPDVETAAAFSRRGVTGFIVGWDQALMRKATLEVRSPFQAEVAP